MRSSHDFCGGPVRQAKARQRRGGRGLAGAYAHADVRHHSSPSKSQHERESQHQRGLLTTAGNTGSTNQQTVNEPASGENKQNNNQSKIAPDPDGHRPQHPYAQGRTSAEQEQAQAAAPHPEQARLDRGPGRKTKPRQRRGE